MTATQSATIEISKPSTKLLQEWTWIVKVEIYDNCTVTIRLYEDRAILRLPGTKWQGNTGGYHLYRSRLDRSNSSDANTLRDLLKIADEEKQDGEDYTDRVKELLFTRRVY